MLCARCDHDLKKHCPGNQQHSDYKEESRLIEVQYRKGTHICHVRHCLNPLCSCVDFVAPAPELPAMFTQPNSPAEIDAYETALARDGR